MNVTSVTKSILRSPCNVTVLIKYTDLLKNTWNGPACGLYRWTRINYEMSFYSALQHLHQSSWSDIFRWSASAQTQIFTRITFSFSLSFSMGRRGGGGVVTMVTNDKCQPAGKRTQRSYVSELHVCLIHRKHVSSRPEIHNHTEIHNTYASRLYNSHFKSHAQPTDLWMQECKYKPWMQY